MNVLAVIQARMGSTRLPGKILMGLEGKPMLWHIVERVKQSKAIDGVVVATTIGREDDATAELCKQEGWLCYRGSAEDVLDRYYQATKTFGASAVVRLTGDCPFIDPFIIDLCVEKFLEGKHDFVSNCEVDSSTFPRGLDVRVISFTALENAAQNAKKPFEREHVWPYVFEHQETFAIGPVVTAPDAYRADYRLTVDYPEDFELAKTLYRKFWRPGTMVNVPEAISFLNNNPDVAAINANCEQKNFKV